MNVFRRLLATLFMIILTALPASASMQTQSPPPGDITVSNSPNSVTAGTMNIETMNIHEATQRDPVTQQFVTTLQNYQRTMSNMVRQAPEAPGYLFLLADQADQDRLERGQIVAYHIIVGDAFSSLFADHGENCQIDSNTRVSGIVVLGFSQGSDQRVRIRLMSREENPILNAICDGLGRPLAWLGTGVDASQDLTVFDFLSRFSGTLSIMILPAHLYGEDVGAGFGRQYWMGALRSRYIRLPQSTDLQADPDIVSQLMRLSEGGEADIRLPLPPGVGNPSSYPDQARREFGARVDRLDSDWLAYIANWAVTVRGERRPLVGGSESLSIATVFRRSDIGSQGFWRAANDMRSILEQVNCIAGRFLSEQDYIPSEDMPDMGACPVQVGAR